MSSTDNTYTDISHTDKTPVSPSVAPFETPVNTASAPTFEQQMAAMTAEFQKEMAALSTEITSLKDAARSIAPVSTTAPIQASRDERPQLHRVVELEDRVSAAETRLSALEKK